MLDLSLLFSRVSNLTWTRKQERSKATKKEKLIDKTSVEILVVKRTNFNMGQTPKYIKWKKPKQRGEKNTFPFGFKEKNFCEGTEFI